jgi:hypothetical protein
MKTEKGALRRALQQAGICIEPAPNQRNKEQPINGNQKCKIAEIAKKTNRSKKFPSRSRVLVEVLITCPDSDS